MYQKDCRIRNPAESGLGLTHPIITARSRSNLFSSRSLRFCRKFSLGEIFVFLVGNFWPFEVNPANSKAWAGIDSIAFLSWCLSADIVEKYAQRLVSFWSCSFVPPVIIWRGFALKDTAVSSFSKSREHWVRSSTLNSAGTLIRELNNFQSASIVGSLKIKTAVVSSILRTL